MTHVNRGMNLLVFAFCCRERLRQNEGRQFQKVGKPAEGFQSKNEKVSPDEFLFVGQVGRLNQNRENPFYYSLFTADPDQISMPMRASDVWTHRAVRSMPAC